MNRRQRRTECYSRTQELFWQIEDIAKELNMSVSSLKFHDNLPDSEDDPEYSEEPCSLCNSHICKCSEYGLR